MRRLWPQSQNWYGREAVKSVCVGTDKISDSHQHVFTLAAIAFAESCYMCRSGLALTEA